jgi:cyclophilin family peptidyl-prolyl cis-trans isomerase
MSDLLDQPAAPELFFERLEARQLLITSPLPTLEMLDDPDHGVVRIETGLGDVDIELFHDAAPQSVQLFLGLLRSGEYAQTFFDRLEAGTRLWGGLYRFDDGDGLSGRETFFAADVPPTLSNLEMTIAMPVSDPQGNPEASGRFVFNLGDNSASDGEFAVFGRVIQGWTVIQQIAMASVQDLTGFFPGDPIGATLTQVPVTINEPPLGVSESLLFTVRDAQVIKPQGVAAFYTERLYFPEGYSWERVFEAIDLMNPTGGEVHYQVLVRYETGSRDHTVSTDSIDAQERQSVVISPGFGLPSNIVRNHTPYGYEIWATDTLVAGFRHKDHQSGIGETFFRPESLPDQAALNEWTFFQSSLGFNSSRVYILWQSLSGEDATVDVSFYFENADPITHSFALEGHRRGGVNVQSIEMPAGETVVGARVVSTQPIVASISRYDRRSNGTAGDEGGIATLGTPGGGSTVGVAPGARRGVQDPLAILNTSSEPATITFFLTQEGSTTPILRSTVVPAGRMMVLSGADNPVTAVQSGQFYSMRYASDVPVTMGFISSAFRGTGTAANIYAARTTHFADARAFTAPRGSPFGQQAISIYNPADSTAEVSLIFRVEGFQPIVLDTFAVLPGEAGHRRIVEFASLLSQQLGGLDGLPQRPYSITVESSVPVVAQASQLNSDGRTELGMTHEVWTPLSSMFS